MNSGKYAASIGVLPLAFGAAAEAQTPAGAVISHQSFVEYFVPEEDRWYEASSTIAVVKIVAAPDFEILQGNDLSIMAGGIIQFPHLIENTGNVVDQYSLSAIASNGSVPLDNLAIFNDINQNGVIDPGDNEITTSNALDIGEYQAVIISGIVPIFANEGAQYAVDFTVTSLFDAAISKSITDRVTVSSTPPFEIQIGSTPICSNPVQANSTVEYDVNMRNVDQLASHADDYLIDGTLQRGFLVFDEIPANTTLVPNQSIDFSPFAGVPVYRNLAGEWSAYDNHLDTDPATAFGLFMPESSLQNAGQSARFEYAVRINPVVQPGMQIQNTIGVDFDGDRVDDAVSNIVCTTIASGTGTGIPPTQEGIRFLQASPEFRQELVNLGKGSLSPQHNRDDHFSDSSRYILDDTPNYQVLVDGVYVEILAPELNTDVGIAESSVNGVPISVKLTSEQTGDILYVNLLETGLNSGLFRSEIPVALSATRSGQSQTCSPISVSECFLLSSRNDKLTAEFTNIDGTTTQIDLATVDPVGVVFNSVSFDAVSGAVVQILQEDGSPAVDAISGHLIAPQTTDQEGLYTIPSLPNGQYYVDVTPPSTYTFSSRVAPSQIPSQRKVNTYSYGKDGYNGIAGSGMFQAGFNAPVDVFDIPSDPRLDTGALSLNKSAHVSYAEFGDTINYKISLQNNSGATVFDAEIRDMPPAGFLFVEGTLTLDDTRIDITREGRDLIIPVGKVDDGETRTIEYRMKIGPEVKPGDAVNSAFASALLGSGLTATSPVAKAIVNISDDGLISDRGYIVGRVWVDLDGDGRKDEDEPAMPNAKIWRDDGSWIITDPEGRFTFYGQKQGRHMLRLDPLSIPDTFNVSSRSARHFNGGQAVMVEIRNGDIVRADFGLQCVADEEKNCSADKIEEIVIARKHSVAVQSELDEAMRYEGQIGQEARRLQRQRTAFSTADGDISSGIVGGRRLKSNAFGANQSQLATQSEQNQSTKIEKDAPPDPETVARTLGKVDVRKGEWIWPKPAEDEKRYARGGPIIAAVRPGINPSLFINGEEVSDKRLGARIETADRKTQIVAWYGVELPSGKNIVSINGTDSFGNARNLAKAELYSPSEGVELAIKTPLEHVYADEQSPISFKVQSLDKDGMPSRGVQFVTIRAEHESNGEPVRFLSEDLQPTTPGHQIRLSEGEGLVELAPLKLPGRIRLMADTDGGMNTFESLEVKAPLRDLFAVGMLDISAHSYKLRGDLEPADLDDYPDKLTPEGKTSLFIKGRIKGNLLLTLAYDSEKQDNEGLFRDIDPEKYYPIYGESSIKGFEAQSSSKLYVRIENKDMSAMWGDYRTDVRQSESLVNQRQSLMGANFQAVKGPVGVRAYVAEGTQIRRSVRFAGQGVALFYSLPSAPITSGSEVLTIEVRAKDNPGLVIAERPLQRFVDYLVDVETGQIVLQEPIASTDVEGNFQFLRARYETAVSGRTGTLAGGEISYVREKTDIRIGGYYDDSRDDIRSTKALSLAAEQKFPGGRAYAEIGVMHSELDDKSLTTGTAFRVGSEIKLRGINIDARLASADADFVNPDSPIIAGRTEARLSARGKVFGSNNTAISGTYSENNDTGDSRSVIEARYEKRFGQWALQFGPRFQDISSGSGGNDESFTSATWRVSRNLNVLKQTATAFVEGEHSLADERERVVIGAESSLGEKTRAYAVHRLVDQLPNQTAATGLSTSQASRHQGKTVYGLETTIIPNTKTFGEWRLNDVTDARFGQASFGMRSDWSIADGVTISPSFERTQTIGTRTPNTGDENTDVGGATNIGTIAGTDDATSLSVSITDASSDMRRKTGRLETRLNSTSHFWGARIGWAEKFTDNITGATKFQLTRDNVDEAPDSQRLKFTSGFAWRPDTYKKPDVFALYQYLDEKNQTRDRQIHLASLHANLQLGEDWTVSGRIAGKKENSVGTTSTAQIFSWKARYDINNRIDTELRLATKSIDWGDATDWNFGLGVGIKASDKFRLHGGYNFGGFNDVDLDPSGYHRRGVYGGVTVALTEDWFGFLKPKD